ncbi:hypothetical protein EVAR_79770_1 [Eumeta japonica]|uniref:Uncharacterized protein n=1 Tax=Eumeta variegata TaxID=151549 RepID=A0A4C1T9J4_EUMVA|nr:hypothetical protein EVAR_79770_1 [Eumeta japonica]
MKVPRGEDGPTVSHYLKPGVRLLFLNIDAPVRSTHSAEINRIGDASAAHGRGSCTGTSTRKPRLNPALVAAQAAGTAAGGSKRQPSSSLAKKRRRPPRLNNVDRSSAQTREYLSCSYIASEAYMYNARMRYTMLCYRFVSS